MFIVGAILTSALLLGLICVACAMWMLLVHFGMLYLNKLKTYLDDRKRLPYTLTIRFSDPALKHQLPQFINEFVNENRLREKSRSKQ